MADVKGESLREKVDNGSSGRHAERGQREKLVDIETFASGAMHAVDGRIRSTTALWRFSDAQNRLTL